MEIQQLPDGNFLLVAVPDEKTEHMARMVRRLLSYTSFLHLIPGGVPEVQAGRV